MPGLGVQSWKMVFLHKYSMKIIHALSSEAFLVANDKINHPQIATQSPIKFSIDGNNHDGMK